MKHNRFRRILLGVLVVTALCTFIQADNREPAPQFSIRTLDGETYTNASLRGNVVLLQFWATWCPYCQRDQAAVDNLERSFADKGLVVVAVNVGESEATVRDYLRQNARSCRIALNSEHLASRFGAHGFPYYVLLDRDGNIAGTQNGGAGEASLRHLLSRAGLSSHSNTVTSGNQSTPKTPDGAKSLLLDVPQARNSAPVKPSPKTIFVMANGERFESDNYTLDASSLRVAVDGQMRSIPLSALNVNATITANHERGIDLKIPKSRSELVIAF